MAIDGLTTIKSNFGPEETMARLKAAVIAKGMTVFAHIDHANAAGTQQLGVSTAYFLPLMQLAQVTPQLRLDLDQSIALSPWTEKHSQSLLVILQYGNEALGSGGDWARDRVPARVQSQRAAVRRRTGP